VVPWPVLRTLPLALAAVSLAIGIGGQRPLAENVVLTSVAPSSPGGSAQLPAPAAGASVVVGQAEYRVSGDEVEIVNLLGGAEARRIKVRSNATNTVLRKIVAMGDRAFILGAGSEMWSLDLKNPRDLTANDLVKVEAPVDFAASEKYLYVISQAPYPYYTLNVLEDLNASPPTSRGFFELGERPDSVAAQGDTVYVLRSGELLMFRVS
jgi:hypothetical protein